jgi:hypothetical protein
MLFFLSKNVGGLHFGYILRRERQGSNETQKTTHSLWRPVTLVHERIHKHTHTPYSNLCRGLFYVTDIVINYCDLHQL